MNVTETAHQLQAIVGALMGRQLEQWPDAMICGEHTEQLLSSSTNSRIARTIYWVCLAAAQKQLQDFTIEDAEAVVYGFTNWFEFRLRYHMLKAARLTHTVLRATGPPIEEGENHRGQRPRIVRL